MKTIYHKYCNDIQNPALGAYIIATFVKNFKEQSKQCPTIIDIFLILPLIIVESTRKLINGEHNIRKMKSFYKELKNTSSKKDNIAMGISLSSIKNYKEYTMCSLIFALETSLVKFNENYDIDMLNYKEYNNEKNRELKEIFDASKNIGKLYAKDYDTKQLLSELGVYL